MMRRVPRGEVSVSAREPNIRWSEREWEPDPYCQKGESVNCPGTGSSSPVHVSMIAGERSQSSENPIAEHGAPVWTIGPSSSVADLERVVAQVSAGEA